MMGRRGEGGGGGGKYKFPSLNHEKLKAHAKKSDNIFPLLFAVKKLYAIQYPSPIVYTYAVNLPQNEYK